MRIKLLSIFFLSALLPCNQMLAQESYKDIKNDTTLWNSRLGSTDKVTESRMNKGLVTNPLEALNGQAAGVSVASSGADRMAMLNSVRVRGTTSLTGGNDPLVIIDGVSSDLATLSTIYPADIESFTILKNASETAQYGSRGASGVIQVATKHGHGAQFHISYDGNIGFESVYKTINMLNRSGYISTAQALGINYNDGGFDTDFQKEITRTGFVQNHHIAFSGGTEKSNYRASIGFMNHNAVVRINQYQNFVAKIDLQQWAFDDILKIDLGVFGSSQNNYNIFDEQKLFYSSATQNPTYPFGRDANGNWNKNPTASQINPPGALLGEKNDEKNLNFNTHIKLEFALTKGLKLSFFGSYSYNSLENAQFCPTWVWAQGQAYRAETKTEDWLGNVTLHYQYAVGIHSFDATLLGEYQNKRQRGFFTLVKGFTSNDFGYDNLGAGSIRPYGGTGSDYENPRLGSIMGNFNYSLLDRYKFTLTTRADGSSMVGKNNRWGFFPSVSFEWDIRKEPFLQGKADWLSQLKLRTGYGESGNLGGISPYNSLQLVIPNGVVPYNGSPTVTMGIMRNANPDLKWETRGTFNIGADMGFWNNRIVMTAEYYYSKTRDMLYLYDVPVPPYAYDKLLANIGSMSNSGFEIGLGVTPILKKDMELNINVNVAFQKNKLISLSGNFNGTQITAPEITSIGTLNGAGFHGGNNNIVYQIVGQPLGVFYLPHCTGLSKNSDGSYSYEIADLDKNGKTNIEDGGDRYIAGQATPKMTLGSNISFRYKAFDVSLQMNGAFGHKIYNGTSLTYMNMSSFPDYNVMAKAPAQNIKDQTATDYWLEKGDYLNFDYLTIGWNVPVKSKYISNLRIAGSVNNLATLTSYSGLTPMINSYIVSNTLGIDDKRSYPCYRSFSFALSIQF
ncbi:MAG: SusC/RagA family TonB-linked outer membrane protein [Prevotella sp.]|jgi:TonB-linked SusC/RagA family outer membrane protein|nr:SusC/RagA family TonB-linked outer membrane protein [Prevotella sp.]MCI1281308.1 SusC/RagA family TonB-linked outer membrane protein [Prevotella sp.]